LIAGLVAYSWKPNKPSAKLDEIYQAMFAGFTVLS
jgi:hypothetical protein